MSKAYTSNHALVNALNYPHMQNGEVIVKMQGEIISGHIRTISMEMGEGQYTEFRITGIINP